jgi:hypothetical protein
VLVLCINTTVSGKASSIRRVRTALPSPRCQRDARQARTRASCTPGASGGEVEERARRHVDRPLAPWNLPRAWKEQGRRQHETRAVLEGAAGASVACRFQPCASRVQTVLASSVDPSRGNNAQRACVCISLCFAEFAVPSARSRFLREVLKALSSYSESTDLEFLVPCLHTRMDF